MSRWIILKVHFRDIQPATEREIVLEFHCFANYESETPFMRSLSYEEYRDLWMKSPQPEEVLLMMEKDLDDRRNIVQFVLVDDVVMGFLWVRFTDISMTFPGASLVVAEVYDIVVKTEHQRKGVGTKILAYIETEARRNGASMVRSGAGIDNKASQALHEKYGFSIYQVLYEKEV